MENYYDIDVNETSVVETKELNEKSFVGGLDGLLRVLTKTMVKKGATANEIAKMQKHVCAQFGIDVGEEFINVTERSEIEKEYKQFNAYVSECIVIDAMGKTETKNVYVDYMEWAKAKGCNFYLTKNRLYKLFRNAGVRHFKTNGIWYLGVFISHTA